MCGRIGWLTHIVALVVVLILFSIVISFSGIQTEEHVGFSSASSSDEVHSPFSFDLANVLVMCKIVRQNDSDGLLSGLKNWLNSLLLALIPTIFCIINKIRSLPYYFRQAEACTCLISISIGGHSPPPICD